MWGRGLSAHREVTEANRLARHHLKETAMIPVSSDLLRVVHDERLFKAQVRQSQRAANAHRSRLRPGADGAGNRPVSAWSSLLIAVRLRPAA